MRRRPYGIIRGAARRIAYAIAYLLAAVFLYYAAVIGTATAKNAEAAAASAQSAADTAQAIRDQQLVNESTFDLLTDCTKPGGTCYAEAQDATAAAVGNISQDGVYRSACTVATPVLIPGIAAEPERLAVQIQRCVDALYDANKKPSK